MTALYLKEADDIWMVKTFHGRYLTRKQSLRSLVQLRLVNYLDGNLETGKRLAKSRNQLGTNSALWFKMVLILGNQIICFPMS